MLFEFFRQNSLITDNNVTKIPKSAYAIREKNDKVQFNTSGKAYLDFISRHKRLSKEIDEKTQKNGI